ncbi:hypothetical protein JR316_0013029 [Psilocybe cubensis]|uniref:Uncharacterized protein n=2 Tax=Psilocybe cubensis TaxID=181762 RepID=A0ACB8GG89_PSICU|nr:hypothetical protein JR316_0013029 [Psilocybe cubensis]KAH9474567.1 hypothetical protein JR316_0013029 [Psilocybe cubensis]
MPGIGLYFRFEDNPRRAIDLLDWLDGHPEERDVIFDVTVPIRGETLTLGACYARAALHLYSTDDDDGTIPQRLQAHGIHGNLEDALAHLKKQLVRNVPDIDKRLNKIFMPFSMQVKYHIHERWKKTYQTVNKEIMESKPEIKLDSILRLDDIEFKPRGTWKVGEIPAETEFLPPEYLWDRLHKYWRNNPTFNQYLRGNLKRSGGRRRRRTTSAPSHGMSTNSDEMSPSSSDSEASGFEGETGGQPSQHRRRIKKSHTPHVSVKRRNSHSVSEISTSSSRTTRSKTRHESYKHGHCSAPGKQSDYRMLELKIKLKQLENEGQEKQAAAELQRLKLQADMEERRRKHEVRMQLLGAEMFKAA